jgi:hypothetical protein
MSYGTVRVTVKVVIGAPGRIRTDNLLNLNQAPRPVGLQGHNMVLSEGFGPPTSRFVV